MVKILYYYTAFLFILGINACTEVYTPEIDTELNALVVEGLLTDNDDPQYVKLSLAKPYSVDMLESSTSVQDAIVTIVDNRKTTYVLSEVYPGIYQLPSSFRAVPNNTYKLRLSTKEGNDYESNVEKLLGSVSYDAANAYYAEDKYFDVFGEYQTVQGAEVRLELFDWPVKLTSAFACRFVPKLTMQYDYIYRDRDINGNEIMAYHWIVFGWKTVNINSTENITKLTKANVYAQKVNHVLGFIPQDPYFYKLVIPPPKQIFYLRVDQYTINESAHRFYQTANDQLAASSTLFDPVTAQVYGNIKSLNEASDVAVGLFDVSSVLKHAFVVDMSLMRKQIMSIKTAPVMEVPADMEFIYRHWDDMSAPPKNDPTYTVIPRPDWWLHD